MLFGIFGKKKGDVSGEVLVGEVIHYFRKVNAAVIKLKEGKVEIGDGIRIRGNTTDFREKIDSMQIDHEPVESASKGTEVAIKVKKKLIVTHEGEVVYAIGGIIILICKPNLFISNNLIITPIIEIFEIQPIFSK